MVASGGFAQCKDKLSGKAIMCHMCGMPNTNAINTDGAVPPLYECQRLEGVLLGYSKPIMWLIFAVFQFGKAMETTGLGRRIALHITNKMGKSLLGMGYGIVICGKCL
jgi:di/tricarboxylate transporter